MKVNKMIRNTSLIIFIVAIILVNVFGFIIGNVKQNVSSFWTIIICSNSMIILEELLILLETRSSKGTLYRLLGAPLHFWAFVIIGIQFVFMLIVSIVNRFTSFPIAIVIIIEILLFAFFIIQFVLGYLVRYFSLGLDDKISKNTLSYENIRKKFQILLCKEMDSELKKDLEITNEKMRYVNPISNDDSKEIDEKINDTILKMDLLLSNYDQNNFSEILSLNKQLISLLDTREILVRK